MSTSKCNNKKLLYAVIFALVFCTVFFTVQNIAWVAYGADKDYSSVLDDLKKDSSFNPSNYPVDTNDNSLKIIQIAESVNKEVFVYVYQPIGANKDLRASSINISTTINDSISFYNYKLKHVNSNGVFYKYVLQDFVVKSDSVRYYAITSIYRPFDSTIDNQADHGNTVTEVEYAVNKQYAFGEVNGKPYTSCVDIETIVITDKFVGFVRYDDGFKLYVGACDSHFVAFNTDKPIDRLLEADVYYTQQSYLYTFAAMVGAYYDFGEKEDKYAYLKYTDKVTHSGGGLFAGTYTWERIETVDNFIKNENITQNVYSGAIIDVSVANKITDDGLAALNGKKWLLRFVETDYSLTSGSGTVVSGSSLVGDVTILRLKFETDGITYNLGVIDNKQTGSDKPINDEEIQLATKETFKWILAIILLILLLFILSPILPFIIRFVFWIISLPFKVFSAIFKSKDKSRKRKRE